MHLIQNYYYWGEGYPTILANTILVRFPNPLALPRASESENLTTSSTDLYEGGELWRYPGHCGLSLSWGSKCFPRKSGFFPCYCWRTSAKGLDGKIRKQARRFWNLKPQPPFSTVKIPKTSFRRQVPSTKIHNPEENTTLAIPNSFSGDLDELEERVKSMMEKSQNKYANGQQLAHRCKVCGKEGMGSAIKDHIEANHLEGIVIPCNLCDKTFRYRKTDSTKTSWFVICHILFNFRSRDSLRHHKRQTWFSH